MTLEDKSTGHQNQKADHESKETGALGRSARWPCFFVKPRRFDELEKAPRARATCTPLSPKRWAGGPITGVRRMKNTARSISRLFAPQCACDGAGRGKGGNGPAARHRPRGALPCPLSVPRGCLLNGPRIGRDFPSCCFASMGEERPA